MAWEQTNNVALLDTFLKKKKKWTIIPLWKSKWDLICNSGIKSYTDFFIIPTIVSISQLVAEFCNFIINSISKWCPLISVITPRRTNNKQYTKQKRIHLVHPLIPILPKSIKVEYVLMLSTLYILFFPSFLPIPIVYLNLPLSWPSTLLLVFPPLSNVPFVLLHPDPFSLLVLTLPWA